MIGSIVGGAMKLGAGIFGGISAARAMRNVKSNLEQQKKDNQNWYDKNYNEDATQRADAQRLLTMTEDSIAKRNRQSAGTAAVMGGTEESVAAAKEANAKALSDTMSSINTAAEARKSQIEQQYMAKNDSLNQQLNAMEQQKAQSIAAAVSGAASAGADVAGAAFPEKKQ
jgi:hypothetical protein